MLLLYYALYNSFREISNIFFAQRQDFLREYALCTRIFLHIVFSRPVWYNDCIAARASGLFVL